MRSSIVQIAEPFASILDDLLLALDLHGVRAESWLDDLTAVSIHFEPGRDGALLGLSAYRRRNEHWLVDLAEDAKALLPVKLGDVNVLG